MTADLAEVYGADLESLWKVRRWAHLLRLIDGLPSASRYKAAMLNDPEMARLIAEQDTGGEYSPPLEEWDTQTLVLSQIYDRLGEVIKAVLATIQVEKGKSPPKYPAKPFPTPRTAVDDAREAMARETGQMLIDWFTPHASGND